MYGESKIQLYLAGKLQFLQKFIKQFPAGFYSPLGIAVASAFSSNEILMKYSSLLLIQKGSILQYGS
jgi:uncharacterized membrane protein